jgi:hypothetical protein
MAVPPKIRTFFFTNYILFVCGEFFKRKKFFNEEAVKGKESIHRDVGTGDCSGL